jgi:hypothetical protein
VYYKLERSYVKQYTKLEEVVYHRPDRALCRMLNTIVIVSLLFIVETLRDMFRDGLSPVFW